MPLNKETKPDQIQNLPLPNKYKHEGVLVKSTLFNVIDGTWKRKERKKKQKQKQKKQVKRQEEIKNRN